MHIFKISKVVRVLSFIILLSSFAITSHAQPAGGKWTQTPVLPLLTNARMIFADSLTGYYIGQDTGYVTKDGGVTWTVMTFPSTVRPAPTYLFTPDPNTIISFQEYTTDSNGVAYPGLIKSTNAGSSWDLVEQTPFFQKGGIKACKMWSANDGFAIWLDLTKSPSPMVCAATHDGGKTFTDIRGDATLQKYAGNLSGNGSGGKLSMQSDWSDSLHGVITITGSTLTAAYPVLLTSDGGRSWTEKYLKFKGDSTVKFFYVNVYPGSNSIWVLPSNAKQAQFYYYSSDFGNTWITSDTIKTGYISKLAPSSSTSVWAYITGSPNEVFLTANHIAYKENSGTWKYIDTLNAGGGFRGPAYAISDIQFNDPYHGWVRAIKQSLNSNNEPVVSDTAFIFRFGTSSQNSVLISSDPTHLRSIPNPASSIITIDGFSDNERIEDVKLSNALGNKCSFTWEKAAAEVRLDIRQQPNGCYFVTINTSQRKEVIPVIIMHN